MIQIQEVITMKKVVTYLLGLFLIIQCIMTVTSPTRVLRKNIDVDNKSPLNNFHGEIYTRFAGGNGSLEDPYQISNITELQNMNLDSAAHFILLNDIDASDTSIWNSGNGFLPIAPDINQEKPGYQGDQFKGSPNGSGYNIKGLYINRPDERNLGLIGCIGREGKISYVNLIDCSVVGSMHIGGLVGKNWGGTISKCYFTGIVVGEYNIGGLVGENF